MLKEQSKKLRKSSPKHVPLLLWGILFIFFGIALYLFGILLSVPRVIFGSLLIVTQRHILYPLFQSAQHCMPGPIQAVTIMGVALAFMQKNFA